MIQVGMRRWSPIGELWCAQRGARILLGCLFLGGTIGMASAQSALPDSQVEANVLRALAGAPELASQAISTNTVYGVVTLSGSVQDETSRIRAENLAANANGVRKVVDELQIGATPDGQATGTQNQPGPGMVLQSDGTYAPAQPVNSVDGHPAAGTAPGVGAVMNDPDNDQAQYRQNGSAANDQPQTSSSGSMQPPNQSTGYPSQQGQYSQGQYPQNGYPQRRYPAYSAPYAQNGGQPWGGQVAGQSVAVPVGTLVRIRVDRAIVSNRAKPGDVFDGFVANDVVAAGLVAIPRGAAVQGRVIDARSSGAISGRGELSIQLTSVTLAGKVYAIASDTWAHSGPDKTGQTVGDAAGLGITGALIGAIVGRGAGAAVGAGVGAAAGVGASAASPKGQVVIPPEGMVSFHLTQPATLQTVSEQEIQRLAYGVPQGNYPRQPMYGRPYGYPAYPAPYGYPAPY